MAETVDCPHCGKQHVTVPDAEGKYLTTCPNKEYVFFAPTVVVLVSYDRNGRKNATLVSYDRKGRKNEKDLSR